ncbi:MAG TPA: hypothetical protein VK399_13205 [Longimicrobiaceae bacterium]|nr:hypothetical protein [Longimicrobiaceae bacterium]
MDFVIPDLSRDLPYGVYLTPQLAQLSVNPVVTRIYTLAKGYFGELESTLSDARAGSDVAHKRMGKLADFPEPGEFGFGFTRRSWRGRGVGNGELSAYILEVMYQCPTLAKVCTVHPDALAFIPFVATDRVSDVIANVSKDAFIEYTQQQADFYGFDPRCMREVPVKHVWDPANCEFVTRRVVVPVREDGLPILLAPKEIVRSSPPVRPSQYTRTFHGVRRSLTKDEILQELGDRPNRLVRLMDQIFEELWRYRPRREFRDRLDR